MSTFEIKLGESAYPLVIGDKDSCLHVTFGDKAYTFDAELLEVQDYGSALVVNLVYDPQLENLAESLSDVVAKLGFTPSLVPAHRVNEDTAYDLFSGYVVVLQSDPSELAGGRLDELHAADDHGEMLLYRDTTGESLVAFRNVLWELFDMIDGAITD